MLRYLRNLIPALLLLATITGQGQTYDAGLFAGGSFYLGDLNPYMKPANMFINNQPTAGGILRYNHNQHVSARLNASFAMIKGSDENSPYNILPANIFEFESSIYELSLQGEINFLPFISGDIETRFTPYLFGGVGGMYFTSKAFENIAGIRTPITDNAHFNSQDNINYRVFDYLGLFGFGFKFNIANDFTAGIEWGFRSTNSHYLDEVRLKGNPENKDWYSVFGLSLTYKFLDRSLPPCPNHNL
jgi:hypothetical protein